MKYKSTAFLIGLLAFSAVGETQRKNKNKEVALTETDSVYEETIVPKKNLIDIAPVLGVSVSEVAITSSVSTQTSASPALNIGFLANLNVTRMFSIETGLLYIPRLTNSKTLTSTTDLTFRQNVLQVPVMARLWVAKYFSFGLGGYVSQAVGNVGVSGKIATGNGNSRDVTNNDFTDRSYKGVGLKTFDYGLTGGIQGRIPMGERFQMLLDGRLDYGLQDLRINPTSSTFSVHGHAVRMFVGGAFTL